MSSELCAEYCSWLGDGTRKNFARTIRRDCAMFNKMTRTTCSTIWILCGFFAASIIWIFQNLFSRCSSRFQFHTDKNLSSSLTNTGKFPRHRRGYEDTARTINIQRLLQVQYKYKYTHQETNFYSIHCYTGMKTKTGLWLEQYRSG